MRMRGGRNSELRRIVSGSVDSSTSIHSSASDTSGGKVEGGILGVSDSSEGVAGLSKGSEGVEGAVGTGEAGRERGGESS